MFSPATTTPVATVFLPIFQVEVPSPTVSPEESVPEKLNLIMTSSFTVTTIGEVVTYSIFNIEEVPPPEPPPSILN